MLLGDQWGAVVGSVVGPWGLWWPRGGTVGTLVCHIDTDVCPAEAGPAAALTPP